LSLPAFRTTRSPSRSMRRKPKIAGVACGGGGYLRRYIVTERTADTAGERRQSAFQDCGSCCRRAVPRLKPRTPGVRGAILVLPLRGGRPAHTRSARESTAYPCTLVLGLACHPCPVVIHGRDSDGLAFPPVGALKRSAIMSDSFEPRRTLFHYRGPIPTQHC